MDKKFTDLVAAGALAAADLLAISQSPFGAGSSKSITGTNLRAFASALSLPLAGGTMTGSILFTDNSFDIGATGGTRPRSLFIGTSIGIQKSAIGSTVTDALLLTNATAAAVGAQQFSTAVRWTGHGWGTTAGTSQLTEWRAYVLSLQSTIPQAIFHLDFSVDGAAFSTGWQMTNTGASKYFAPAASSTGQVGLSLTGDAASRVAMEITNTLGSFLSRVGFGMGVLGRDAFFLNPAAGVIWIHALAPSVAGNFGVLNTATSPTNFEVTTLGWTANVAHIWTEKGSGGGTARALVLGADSTELLRFGSATTLSFFAQTAVVRQTGGENVTNSVTDTASTNGTIPDIATGVYATDYTNLRNALFQLARMLKQDHDALRAYGLLT